MAAAFGTGDLTNPIPEQDGQRYVDDNMRPVYGGRYWDVKGGAYVPGTSSAETDEAHYRALAERTNSAPYIDQSKADESRGLGLQSRDLSMQSRGQQMGSLGMLEAGARGDSADQQLLRSGADGTTNDMGYLQHGAAGDSADLALLHGAATGAAPSKAEILGKQMSDRALHAQVSAAGNVRGGPGASASAFRAVHQNAALQRADMNAGIQAGRADELAGARNAYAGASGAARTAYSGAMGSARKDYGSMAGAARRDYSSGAHDLRAGDAVQQDADSRMRGQDLGVATDQAKLVAQQREADAQNERYYVGLDNSTKFGVLASQTGSTDAAYRERMGMRQQENAEAAADWGKTKDTIGMVGAVGSGAMSAAQMYGQNSGGGGGGSSSSSSGGYSNGIYHDDPYSDVKTKEPVAWGSLAPLTWGDAPGAGETRDSMTSDQAAKEQAFSDGMNHAQRTQDEGQAPPMPDYLTKTKPPKPRAMQTFQRQDPELAGQAERYGAWSKHDDDLSEELASPANNRKLLNPIGSPGQKAAAGMDLAIAGGAKASSLVLHQLAQSKHDEAQGPLKRGDDPSLDERQMKTFDRETTTSDEETKERFGDVPDDKMAGAMRSMEPHPYAYKPEFAAKSGQKPGEVNIGPMANAMAENPVASTAIVKDQGTDLLAIDKDKGLKLVMGSLASLQHQLDSLHGDVPRANSANGYRRGRSAQP